MFDTHVNLTPILLVVLTGFVVPFGTYLGHTGLKLAERVLEPYIGQKNALVLQQRADALLDRAIGAAAKQYLPQLQAQGLTVDLGNHLVAWAVDYAVNHNKTLVDLLNTWEGELQEKIDARLLTHPAVQAAVALPAPVAAAA